MVDTIVVKTSKKFDIDTSLLVLYVCEGETVCGQAEQLWRQTGYDWQALINSAKFEGKQGQVLDLLAPNGIKADRLLILGAGKSQSTESDSNSEDRTTAGERSLGHLTQWTDRGGSLFAKIAATKLDKISVILDETVAAPDEIAELEAGLHLRNYKFDKYKTSKTDEDQKDSAPKSSAKAILLHVSDKSAADQAIKKRGAVTQGTLLARDLLNEPANSLGPAEFAEIASDLKSLGLVTEVLDADDMEKLGMGALLCVAQGSPRPAHMVIMQWNGGKKSEAPIAFVGKGVCFDSGGLSLKPAPSMEDMKGDMGGAAAVTGLMKTLALRKAKVNVVGVIGLVENMPDGLSVRPGDIVTAMSGTTIEVLNTDAEGRLVLADALWYTQDRFKPKAMVNLATLTGAIMVALGRDYAGMMSNDDELSEKLFAAGMETGEKLWRLPLSPAYDKLIISRVADIKNLGGRFGGAITAAQFLQRFVNKVPWAHLDIAGTAFAAPGGQTNRGWAPGFGVALLNQYVLDNHEA